MDHIISESGKTDKPRRNMCIRYIADTHLSTEINTLH